MINISKISITEIISAIFIFLFLYTGISKSIEHDSFTAVLGQSPLIGNMSNILSWSIPAAELYTAILLFIPATRKLGLWNSFILMTIFTIYIFYMILFTPHLPCSCGGVLAHMKWKQHLIFNIFFTTLAAIGLRIKLKHKIFIAINRQS